MIGLRWGAGKGQDWMRMLGFHADQSWTQSKESDYGRDRNIWSETNLERSLSFFGLSDTLAENDDGRTPPKSAPPGVKLVQPLQRDSQRERTSL